MLCCVVLCCTVGASQWIHLYQTQSSQICRRYVFISIHRDLISCSEVPFWSWSCYLLNHLFFYHNNYSSFSLYVLIMYGKLNKFLLIRCGKFRFFDQRTSWRHEIFSSTCMLLHESAGNTTTISNIVCVGWWLIYWLLSTINLSNVNRSRSFQTLCNVGMGQGHWRLLVSSRVPTTTHACNLYEVRR